MKVCAKGTKTLQAHKSKAASLNLTRFLKKSAKMKVCAKGTKTLPAHISKVATLKLTRFLKKERQNESVCQRHENDPSTK